MPFENIETRKMPRKIAHYFFKNLLGTFKASILPEVLDGGCLVRFVRFFFGSEGAQPNGFHLDPYLSRPAATAATGSFQPALPMRRAVPLIKVVAAHSKVSYAVILAVEVLMIHFLRRPLPVMQGPSYPVGPVHAAEHTKYQIPRPSHGGPDRSVRISTAPRNFPVQDPGFRVVPDVGAKRLDGYFWGASHTILGATNAS